MKREFLKELGLTDEQIDKIMGENGKDVEKSKGDLVTTQKELASTKKQLETANTEIQSYKDMDIETIKKNAEGYKTKFEVAEKKAKEEIEALKFEHSLESALNKAGAKNAKAAKALLDIETLKSSKNTNSDIESAITTLKESDAYLFETAEPDGTGGSLGNNPKGKPQPTTITKEDFNKMGYMERVELKQKNEELYNKLNE